MPHRNIMRAPNTGTLISAALLPMKLANDVKHSTALIDTYPAIADRLHIGMASVYRKLAEGHPAT
jgi:hypothetical protein